MEQKTKKIIIISVLLLTVLACGLGGYTYAKYRTAVRGGGQVEVAKWSFKVNNSSEQIETINLEDTIAGEYLLANGKIAPGAEGQFSLLLDATESEVGVHYDIEFKNEKNKPQNLKFIYEGQTYNSLTELSKQIIGNILANEENKVKEITIRWRWKYETGTEDEIEENDEIDTQNGIEALNYTFNVIVTGTQMPLVEG